MAEGGFREAQVAAVAARAGVATGTVYRHFPSKAELFIHVFRVVVQREVDVVRAIAQGEGPVLQRLEAAVRGFSQRAMVRPRLAYALIAEPVDPAIEAERLRYRHAYAEVFASLIAEGLQSGELAEQDPGVSAACLVGGLAEALVGPLAPDHQAEEGGLDRLIDEVAGFCVRAVKGR